MVELFCRLPPSFRRRQVRTYAKNVEQISPFGMWKIKSSSNSFWESQNWRRRHFGHDVPRVRQENVPSRLNGTGHGTPMRVTIETSDMGIVERIRAVMPAGVRLHVRPAEAAALALPPTTGTAGDSGIVPLPDLTRRQCEILELLMLGLSNKAIGRKLSLSHFTVRNHISQIMRQLGVSTRKEVIARLEGLTLDARPSKD